MLKDEILTKATKLHEEGKLEEAEALYRQLLEVAPNDGDALHLLGIIAHQKGSPATAVDYMYKAVIVDGLNPSYHADLGTALFEWGKISEAISSYEKSLELNPDQPNTYFMMAQAYRGLEAPMKAVSAFKKAIELKPNFFEAYYCMANALKEDEQFKDAIKAFGEAQNLAKNHPVKKDDTKNSNSIDALIFNEIGECFDELDEVEAALKNYTQATKVDNNLALAYYNQGNVLIKKEMYDDAIAAYKKSLDIDPNLAASYCNIGNIHAFQKNFGKAIESYKTALEIDPKNSATLNNLALFVRETIPNDEEALGLLFAALTYNPDIEKIHENIVDSIKSLRIKGEMEKAEKIAKNWLKHFPNNPIDKETIKEITNDFMPKWIQG
jgi:tetratricopeptide (TPR) repeat protein